MAWLPKFRFSTGANVPFASSVQSTPSGLNADAPSFFWLWVGVTLVSLLIGTLLAMGLYPIVLALVVAALGPLLIIYPWSGMWIAVFGSLVVSGLIDLYVPKLRPLSYGLMLLCFGLAAFTAGANFLRIDRKKGLIDKTSLPLCLLLFAVCITFSAMANWHGILTFGVGMKSYFQVWGIFITAYYLIDNEKDAARLMRFILVLGVIQLPFVFHEFIFLVPKRMGDVAAEHGLVAIDVVAGTFGGAMMGGGRSPSMALLLVTCLTIVGAAWRSGQMKFGRAVVLAGLFTLPILLSEVKIVVVLIPMALYLLFRDQIKRHPLKAAMIAGAMGLMMVALFSIYLSLPGAKSQQHKDLNDYFQESVSYNLGDRGYGGAILNRKTVYSFWLAEHSRGDTFASLLIGHGPGQTNEGSNVMKHTLATDRYAGYGIDTTGISSLLWEVGVLGTFATLAMFFSAYRLGGKLARRWDGTAHWPLLKGAEIAMPMFAVSLLHNNYFVVDISLQALLAVTLGYMLVMARMERKPA